MKRFAGRFNWKQIAIIMTLVTVISPNTTYLLGIDEHEVYIAVYALLWSINLQGTFDLHVLNGPFPAMGILLGVFNILFAFQIVQYAREEVGKTSVLIFGCLTLVMPLILLVVALPHMITYSQFVYIGPIPIQLLIGLVLMSVAKQPIVRKIYI